MIAGRESREQLDVFVNAVTMLLQFVHISLLQNVLEVYPCRELVPGSSVLKFHTSVQCNSDEHRHLKDLAILFLMLWTVGIPAILFIVLGVQASMDNLYSLRNRTRFGYLTLRYTAHNWWWEWVVLSRKSVIVILLVFMTDDDEEFDQVAAAFFAVFAFFVLHVIRQPFVEYHLNLYAAPTDLSFSSFNGW
jgi:hypothetical protein